MLFSVPFSGAPWPSSSSELSWVLDRAFAVDMAPGLRCGEPSVALGLARRLELSGRVASRLGPVAGRAELGDDVGRDLHDDFLTNVAVASSLREARGRIQGLASRHGMSTLWLKFAALDLAGVSKIGSRVALDLDVLAEERSAEALWRALRDEAGFYAYGGRAHEHQLPALRDAAGVVVEVHVTLPGVRGADGKFARLTELGAGGHVRKVVDGQLRYAVPSFGLLAAHALAHGLLQNYSSPQSYSPMRMLADLSDIAAHEPSALPQSERWLAPPLKRLGIVEVERALSEVERGAPAGSGLLRHCLAARLSEPYAQRLRTRGWLSYPTDLPRWRNFAMRAYWLLFPSSLELEGIYGPAASPWAGRVRRFQRPVDLVKRGLGTLFRLR